MEDDYSNSKDESNYISNNLNNSDNGNTIRSKLLNLDSKYSDMIKQLEDAKSEVKNLINERAHYQQEKENDNDDDKNTVMQDLDVEMNNMKKKFESQKEENNKLQLRIAKLKTDKTVLQGKYIALQRRVNDIERQVGTEETK